MLSLSDTGDVCFVCLERMQLDQRPSQPQSSTPRRTSGASHRSSSSSSYSSFQSRTTARKRVIFAHSDILKHRSEYFSNMLSSSFSENVNTGDRKPVIITIEEADFVTVYW